MILALRPMGVLPLYKGRRTKLCTALNAQNFGNDLEVAQRWAKSSDQVVNIKSICPEHTR